MAQAFPRAIHFAEFLLSDYYFFGSRKNSMSIKGFNIFNYKRHPEKKIELFLLFKTVYRINIKDYEITQEKCYGDERKISKKEF